MILHLITPLSRVANLQDIIENVFSEWKNYLSNAHLNQIDVALAWTIVTDGSVSAEGRSLISSIQAEFSHKRPDKFQMDTIYQTATKNAAGGHLLRNIALKAIQKDFPKHSGYVLNLDDDNLLYPNFFLTLIGSIQSASKFNSANGHSILCWSQLNSNGTPRLIPNKATLKVGFVDTAMYAFSLSFLYENQIEYPDDYCGDGLLMESLISIAPEAVQIDATANCWYNKLRP